MQTYIKYLEFYVGLHKNKTHSSIKMSVNLSWLYTQLGLFIHNWNSLIINLYSYWLLLTPETSIYLRLSIYPKVQLFIFFFLNYK